MKSVLAQGLDQDGDPALCNGGSDSTGSAATRVWVPADLPRAHKGFPRCHGRLRDFRLTSVILRIESDQFEDSSA
ncbi:MAG: hypothetical protein CBC13_07135 [Planctomycetia bacterium TMED53]|nr:MAG: hypothetical protein CBC13_07135 [Planctomycetia bacterium TMED53]